MLIALVLVVTIADLVVSRGQAQLAADAAALAAMADEVQPGWDPTGDLRARAGQTGHTAAEALARANGGELLECCGGVTARRDVEVGVEPRSLPLRWVVPRIRARAAAALEPVGSPVRGLHAVGVASTTTGDRVWPVDGPVSSGFGGRVHPMTGSARMHAGLDLAVPAGTPVRAAAAGRVVHDGAMGGYGLTVDVAHGHGTVTRYAHQSRVLVTVGQSVAAGQVIGLAGSTGASTGPHLHFEVRTPAGAIDPRTWLPAASR
jgi:murein DD-endopeptidase MepM/ murein hydrolase activator NlpD